MAINMSFTDLEMVEYPEGFLSISVIIIYPTTSLIHLNWYATKQDAEAGNPYIKQTCYDVDNSIFTSVDFHGKSYEYIMTLPEFSSATLEVAAPVEPPVEPPAEPNPEEPPTDPAP